MVEIKKLELDAIQKQLKRLEFAASKKDLSRYDQMQAGPKESLCTIGKYKGKYVLGWSNMTENICEKNEKDIWHEVLRTTLFLNDGKGETEKLEVNYTEWQRNHDKLPAKILERTVGSNGNVDLKVELENGQKLKLGVEFVNP